MIYVINGKDNKVLNKIDAWQLDGEALMRVWIRKNGYVLTDIKITFMGDMVMTVF